MSSSTQSNPGFSRVSPQRTTWLAMAAGATFAALALCGVGCSDPGGKPAPAGSATANAVSAAPSAALAPSGSAAASAAASNSASPATSGSATAGGATWKGSFKTKVTSVALPKDIKVDAWQKDPGTTAVGDGTISLTVTPTPSGKFSRVVGEGSGVLGDLVISGTLDADGLTAQISAKDPKAPNAMNGTLTGKVDGAKIDATLHVSSRDANVVREASFTLTHLAN
ncbi:MAG: hypothetical protein U0165_19105 [Polyangiaceae bacterium]